VVVPFRPVKRGQQPLNAVDQLQHLRRELLIIDARVAEQPVEVIQRTAQLRSQVDREVTRHGQGGRLGPLGNRSDHQGQRLLLRTAKGA
jgi:hypothetical protein